jgi:creatinine amidohydrolase/Fe(II)-dependent formamide hydrolase-like protein
MQHISDYLPQQVNEGSFLTAYTLDELRRRTPGERIVLPICSLGTPVDELKRLAPFVLPPLYHEALDPALRQALVERIRYCFPYFTGTKARAEYAGQLEIVELPPQKYPGPDSPRILAFSVDTAVEEHGPHLPLATDTIQSYAVLHALARECPDVVVGPPVEYGQLTWGLPFGFSIDITAPLLTRYVTRFANAVLDWCSPAALYVVDVHGSLIHRTAIQTGLAASRARRWSFRWLHEPLTEFAGDRGDQHAGGVETSLVHHINPRLVDTRWWPERIDALAAGQMPLPTALDLAPTLDRFITHVESTPLNGIVGDIRNFYNLDPALMFHRMLTIARQDVEALVK